MSVTTDEIKEHLIDDAKVTLSDAEDLLRAAASSTGEKAAELREKAIEALRRARIRLHETQDAVLEKGRRAYRVTDDYVHDKPWHSVGIAAAVGVLLGVLISRR